MTREDISVLHDVVDEYEKEDVHPLLDHKQIGVVKRLIAELEQTRWIPIDWHYITDEEREKEGYPDDWVYFLDSKMPEGNQEILITVRSKHGNYVEKDTCLIDEGYYLDSGYDWRTDVIAWMPLPKPYEEESEE